MSRLSKRLFSRVFGLDLSQKSSFIHCGGVVASWLVRSPPDRAVRARALAKDLAKDIVLCS